MICMTFPAPEALAASSDTQQLLLAQAYPPPPGYPPGYAPPPPGYGMPPMVNEVTQAQIDGRADVPNNVSGTLWFVAGFFLSWIGILLGYLLTPSPDGARLVGKSPAYVQAYTEAYGNEGRSFQGIHAVYGCVTSGIIYIVFFVIYFIAVAACATTAVAAGD
jgi:hypothetical protein